MTSVSVIVLMKTITLSPVSMYVEYTILIHFSYAWFNFTLIRLYMLEESKGKKESKVSSKRSNNWDCSRVNSVQIKCGGLKNSTIPLNVG